MRLIHTSELKSVNQFKTKPISESVSRSSLSESVSRSSHKKSKRTSDSYQNKTQGENLQWELNCTTKLEHPTQKETELTFQGVYFHQVLFRIQLSHFKLFCKHSSHKININTLMIIISNGFTIASRHRHLEHGWVSFFFY